MIAHPNTPEYRTLRTEWERVTTDYSLTDRNCDLADQILELDYQLRQIEGKFLTKVLHILKDHEAYDQGRLIILDGLARSGDDTFAPDESEKEDLIRIFDKTPYSRIADIVKAGRDRTYVTLELYNTVLPTPLV
jgi:hypothetical protein